MTREQTAVILAAVKRLWPYSNLGGAVDDIVDTWHSFLAAFDAHAVEGAIRELAAQGREQAPPVGVVVKTVAERTADVPDFDEAWTEIERLKNRYHPAHPGREVPPPERFSHPLVAGFAIPAWRELCLGPAPGTKNFGTFYAQQREAWKALAHRHNRSVALGAVGAPRRRGELVRPDFAAALPAYGGTDKGEEAA